MMDCEIWSVVPFLELHHKLQRLPYSPVPSTKSCFKKQNHWSWTPSAQPTVSTVFKHVPPQTSTLPQILPQNTFQFGRNTNGGTQICTEKDFIVTFRSQVFRILTKLFMFCNNFFLSDNVFSDCSSVKPVPLWFHCYPSLYPSILAQWGTLERQL